MLWMRFYLKVYQNAQCSAYLNHDTVTLCCSKRTKESIKKVFLFREETNAHLRAFRSLFCFGFSSDFSFRDSLWVIHIDQIRSCWILRCRYSSSSENKAWKKFRPVRDLNPWALRYRCSALSTELTSQLEAGHHFFSGLIFG